MSRRPKRKATQQQAATTTMPASPTLPGKWATAGICVLLAALVWTVFGQTLQHDFVHYDDNVYVYENPNVTGGLSATAILRAFTHSDLFLWTPLTTISHMLDCQVYGLHPLGHHLTNVLLHAAAVIVLFLVLQRMTGAPWRSAFVAAVFAIHPLRVESVAWVAERKDVLSGLFFALTLGAYLFYIRKRSVARYALVALLFACGLMAKQMLVTLPCVLLLLDYWPLKRFAPPDGARGGTTVFPRLLAEKIPLLALSAASCAQTLMTGSGLRAIVPVAHPFLLRAGNALVCYFVYIFQMFYPADLAPYYPYPAAVPAWEALGALALLAGISIAAFALRGKHPAFLTGWFWYVGMMAPVIGFVPVGREGHADRYTYLPQIGLYIAIAWMCADACARLRLSRVMPGIAMGAVVAALVLCARAQTSYWKNDETLWNRTIAIMPDNAFAHNNLGKDLESDGNTDGAMDQYRQALEIQPDYPEARTNMGIALFNKGDVTGAIGQYEAALNSNPNYPDARNNLGYALFQDGQGNAAIAQYRKALAIDPGYVGALNNLGNALATRRETGDLQEAMDQYRKAIAIKPGYADSHSNLANTLLMTGRLDDALAEYQKAVDLDPKLVNAQRNLGSILVQQGRAEEALPHLRAALKILPHDPGIQNNLARVLATAPQASLRDGALALELAKEANQTTGGRNPIVLRNLAAAYAETGVFSKAVETARQALALVDAQSNAELADLLRSQIALYQAGTPYRDKSLISSGSNPP